MNFRQIEIIHLKAIFKPQIIFLSFPLLVQNYKLQLFFWSQIKQKNPSIFKRRKFIVPYEITS